MAALLAAFAFAPSVGWAGTTGARTTVVSDPSTQRQAAPAPVDPSPSETADLCGARSGGARARRVRGRQRRDLHRRRCRRRAPARHHHPDPHLAVGRAGAARSHAVGIRSLALIGCVLASGCYHGSARTATPADLADQPDGWNLVEGVPPVRQIEREDCGAAALAMVLGYWGLPITRDAISAGRQPGRARARHPGGGAARLRPPTRSAGLPRRGPARRSRARARPASPGPGRCHEAVRPAPLPPLRGRGGHEPPRPARSHPRSRARSAREQPRGLHGRVDRCRQAHADRLPVPAPRPVILIDRTGSLRDRARRKCPKLIASRRWPESCCRPLP